MISDERLAELKALCDAATPGPWAWEKSWEPNCNYRLVAACDRPDCDHANLELSQVYEGDDGQECFLESCADDKKTVMAAEYDRALEIETPVDYRPEPHDADFIAAARTVLPQLIAEVERLKKQIDDIKEEQANNYDSPGMGEDR